MTAKILSERIHDLELAHRMDRSEHEGCDVCILFNHFEVHLARFEEARLALAPPERRKR